MMLRKSVATLGAFALFMTLVGTAAADEATADHVVSIGTLAPEESEWGKVFKAWSKAVLKKSDGKLGLKWYYNGGQGDEVEMVGKMRSQQLDGAAVTSVGLSEIHDDFLALQMPGL